MDFKFIEARSSLYQVKINKMYFRNGRGIGMDCVCRIPVHHYLEGSDGLNDIWAYELLPGYDIVQPDRIKIDKTEWFAYLFYDNLYMNRLSQFNRVTVDEKLTGGTIMKEYGREIIYKACNEGNYWCHVLCESGMVETAEELKKWTDTSLHRLLVPGYQEVYEGEFLYDDEFRYIIAATASKKFMQSLTDDFIEENF